MSPELQRAWGIPALLVVLSLAACANTGTTSLPPDVGELMPGYMAGYLPHEDLPDSLAILPPPPQAGSAAQARDDEAAEATCALWGSPRWERAMKDAVLLFPAAAERFEEVLGFAVTEDGTPWTYHVLRRTLADAGLATDKAKKHYQRPRPFMVNGQQMGIPDATEEQYRKDGSYPSGHTAAGFAWALVLAELVPDRATDIIRRGIEFGRSRNVLNVHWRSDVEAGYVIAAATFARLQADEEFRHDMEMARREVSSVRVKASK
jgi:acid phosphatase (class A)